MDGHAGPVRALGRVRESCPRACVARRQRTAGKQVARGSPRLCARGGSRTPAFCGARRSPPSLANRLGGEGGIRARRQRRPVAAFVAVDSFVQQATANRPIRARTH